MKGSNTLTSHTPESSNQPARKMGGWYHNSSYWVGKSKRFWKKFYSKKRRQLLKNFTLDKV